MNLNLVPKQLPSIILAATANSSPAYHFSPLKKPFFPPRCDEIASLACLGNDFSAGLWTWCFPQVEGRIGCVCLCPYSRVIVHVCASICIFVCDLIVRRAACDGSSKSISLQENVRAQTDLSHLSHTFYILQSVSQISKAVLLPDKEKKKRKSDYLTEICYNHLASKMNVLLHKQTSLCSPLLSLSDSDINCHSKDCMLHTTDMSEAVSTLR